MEYSGVGSGKSWRWYIFKGHYRLPSGLISILGEPSFHFVPNADDSTRTANERPLTLRFSRSVNVSTGDDAVLTAVPAGSVVSRAGVCAILAQMLPVELPVM